MKTCYTSLIKKHLFPLILIAIVSTSLAVNAAIYKWTDADGNVHYGGKPPAESNAEQMGTKPAANSNPYQSKQDADAEKKADEEIADEEKAAEEKAAEEKAAEEKANKPPEPPEPTVSAKGKKILCQQARNEKQQLIEKPRLRDANRNFLSDEQRSKRMSRANKEIREYCR